MGRILLASIVVALAIICSPVYADPDNLQVICPADLNSAIKMNGFACRDTPDVVLSDFLFKGLATPGATNNLMGSKVTLATVVQLPGLNTLGISLARIDFAPGGLNPPHTHPRATEVVFVLEGQLDVGFITTDNSLISTTIKAGDVFLFPKGHVHFQKNRNPYNASVLSSFNSQLPGTQSIAATLFTSNPTVANDILAQTFQISNTDVMDIKKKLTPKA